MSCSMPQRELFCLYVLVLVGVVNAGYNLRVDDGKENANVLVTGFEPFLSYSTNPSEKVSKLLNSTCSDGLCFKGFVLPVNHTGAQRVQRLVQESEDFPFQAIIHMGLEDSSRGLRIETVAANILADSSSTNRHGAYTSSCTGGAEFTPAIDGADEMLPTTMDLGRLDIDNVVDSMPQESSQAVRQYLTSLANGTAEAERAARGPGNARQVPTRRDVVWSRDAGAYYCNETLFRTLFSVRRMRGRRGGRYIPVVFVHLPNEDHMDVETMAELVRHLALAMVESAPSHQGAVLV